MAPTVKRIALTATLPTLLAIATVALAVLERVAVDPSVSAGWAGSSSIPVWYVPLAVFAIAHAFLLLVTMRGRTLPAVMAGTMVLVLAAIVHFLGWPFTVGEAVYWIPVVLALFLPPLFVLLPVVIVLAVASAGVLYGLLIYAPIAAARQVAGNSDTGTSDPTWRAFALGGVIVALICVAAFGLPSEAGRAARGNYAFDRTTFDAEWLKTASVVAVCCAVMALAGALENSAALGAALASWLAGFVVPVAAAVAAGGVALSSADANAALRAVNSIPVASALSRFFRDGRPRADEPIRFANGELRIDRSLLGYQLADNPQRRISTVALRPPAELMKIGVTGRIILNAWHAEPHRKEAEYRRAVCTDSPSRPVVECRLPATGAVVIEIDKARPERGLERRALGPDPGCRIIITGVAGRSFGIRADFDCAKADDWPRHAAEIERYFLAAHFAG